MKLTKTKLKQLIKEELKNLKEGDWSQPGAGSWLGGAPDPESVDETTFKEAVSNALNNIGRQKVIDIVNDAINDAEDAKAATEPSEY